MKFVYAICPYTVKYVNFIKLNYAGLTTRFKIEILNEYKDDIGLLEHEKIHVKQWYRTFFFHTLFYNKSEKYRLKSEVEAYKKQLEYNPENIDCFAEFISSRYNLKITKEEAKSLLV